MKETHGPTAHVPGPTRYSTSGVTFTKFLSIS
jgi:hypothetical protein